MISVDVSASGPVFDGRWESIMLAYKEHVEDELGNEAVHRIRIYLPTQYMYLGFNGGNPIDNPVPSNAGWLQSRIESHRETVDRVMVTDGGYPATIYGPWIEGIGPGNYYVYPGRIRRGLTPRFPGYGAFRKISNELEMEAGDLATAEFPPYLTALNE